MDLSLLIDHFILIIILTIVFSVLIDFIVGDPHFKYHPVMLIGMTINWLKSKFRTGKSKLDKFLGILLLLFVILIFCIPLFLFQISFWWIWNIWNPIGWKNPDLISLLIFTLGMGFILKWAFAVKNLGDSTRPIGEALKRGDLETARSYLSSIVRRELKTLDESHIISATVECIAESSTDAVISVFWFYLMGSLIGGLIFTFFHSHFFWLLLGIPAAYIFRIINTADSVVGYKDPEHINIGWFSAKMDDFSNYIPTRLTVLFMLVAGKIMRKDVRNAWKILKSDKNITESVNAGWTMSTMAGLLKVQLEKIGNYKLGVSIRPLSPDDIKTALNIIKLTIYLFILIISTIIILIIFSIFIINGVFS
ncbi:MAG: cobalamin biosynthesis protein [Promethearchaeota archaeon]